MEIHIIGIGPGNKENLTAKALKAIEGSDMIIGHSRMLKAFSYIDTEKVNAYLSKDILGIINRTAKKNISILVSGDIGFFSATKKLLSTLKEYKIELIPGISSIVYFSSKVGLSWDDMNILSLHGRDSIKLNSISENEKTFLLTGGENSPEKILSDLKKANIKDLYIYIGENLSYSDEKITKGTLESLINKSFSSLSVMIIENKSPRKNYAYRNILDNEFIRGKVPMTKSEVRNIVIGKLKLKKDDSLYDIGAGTGSISIEASLLLPYGEVYSIEKNPDAIKLINSNREKFKAYNIKTIEGEAPSILENLKPPNKVFIGGSRGSLEDIINSVLKKNPKVRIVTTGVSLETISEAFRVFKKLELNNVEIVQVAVSKAKSLGEYNMMIAENPIYIFSGDGKDE